MWPTLLAFESSCHVGTAVASRNSQRECLFVKCVGFVKSRAVCWDNPSLFEVDARALQEIVWSVHQKKRCAFQPVTSSSVAALHFLRIGELAQTRHRGCRRLSVILSMFGWRLLEVVIFVHNIGCATEGCHPQEIPLHLQ